MKRECVIYGDKFPNDFAVCGEVLFIGHGHSVAKILRRLKLKDPNANHLVLRDKSVRDSNGEDVTTQWHAKLAEVNKALALGQG